MVVFMINLIIKEVQESKSARQIRPTKEGIVLERREFLKAGLGTAAYFTIAGCATNPVTGRKEFSLISEAQEISIDQEYAPEQFSNDYGPVQNSALNSYVNHVGLDLAQKTHRSHMPYSFRVTNAYYMNAYTFPGGTVAITRYLLASLEDEEQLAGIWGHELGHVNARHTSASMSRAMLIQGVIGATSLVVGQASAAFGQTTELLGALGSKLYLASYSRDNERQADELGQMYMAKAGYNPMGLADTMELFMKESQRDPSFVEVLFATHPMSSERYTVTKERAEKSYSSLRNAPTNRERYMDYTQEVRSFLPMMKALGEGDKAMARKDTVSAEEAYKSALKYNPDDYVANCRIGEFYLAVGDNESASMFLEKARTIYPQEARAAKALGASYVQQRQWDRALQNFNDVDHILPGNPELLFIKGLCYEGMGRREPAAQHYAAYLQQIKKGKQAQYSYSRLKRWGYFRTR
jgi:predicted Zn-dependent protease